MAQQRDAAPQITYRYDGDGKTRIFPIPWPYIEKEYAAVSLHSSKEDETGRDITALCTWITDSSIQLPAVPPKGSVVVITRETPYDKTLVTFHDGSVQLADDLNLSDTQFLHVIQELKDALGRTLSLSLNNSWDAKGHRIINVGDPLDPQDAATKNYVDITIDRIIQELIDEWGGAIDADVLSSYAQNVRHTWVATEDIPSGSVLKLPAHYYPKRNILFLGIEGMVCTPRKAGGLAYGAYQYEEVGESANELSNEVIIHFPISKGDLIDCWVVASNLMKEIAKLEAAAEKAAQHADRAEFWANKIMNITVRALTYPPGSEATAHYDVNTGIITIGVPRGDKGEKGDQGDRGLTGRGLFIEGFLNNKNELPAGGSDGGWIVNRNLFVWDAVASVWEDCGPVQGPQGVKGDKGDSPHIGENNNWWIGAEDTGVAATFTYTGNIDGGTPESVYTHQQHIDCGII